MAEPGKASWFANVKGYLGTALPIVGSMLLGVAAFNPANFFWLGVVGVCATVGGLFATVMVRPSYAQMLKERPVVREYIDQVESELTERFESVLKGSEFLKPRGRASLYVEDGGWFICVARVSGNPDYAKPGRIRLRRRELDIISEAWSKGQCKYGGIPNGEENPKEWIGYHHERHAMEIADLEKMRMKSRAYSGYQIKNGSTAIGVVIFESLNKNIKAAAPYFSRIQENQQILDTMEKLATYSELIFSHSRDKKK